MVVVAAVVLVWWWWNVGWWWNMGVEGGGIMNYGLMLVDLYVVFGGCWMVLVHGYSSQL